MLKVYDPEFAEDCELNHVYEFETAIAKHKKVNARWRIWRIFFHEKRYWVYMREQKGNGQKLFRKAYINQPSDFLLCISSVYGSHATFSATAKKFYGPFERGTTAESFRIAMESKYDAPTYYPKIKTKYGKVL